MPVAIAWIAAHAAIASGVPLWLSILIGSVVLLLLAITANYIKTLFQKGRHGTEAVHSNAVPEVSNKPKPNLVSFDARIVLVGQDSDDTLYQCEFTQEVVIGGAAVAFIKNEVNDQPIGQASSVRAHISFSEITGPRRTEINNALWLGSRHRRKNFEVGDTERLIIAVKPVSEGDVYAIESNYVTRAGERVYSPLYPKLLGKIYIVTVKLVGGEHGEINQTFQYRLETKPDFYIEQIDETQAPKSTAEVERLRSEIVLLRQTVSEAQAEAQSWREQYDEEHNAALRLKTVTDQYEIQINKLKSDAEEARREKIAADSNLQGVEHDRNNYRTWFNELSWLKPTIERQQNDISNHVEVVAVRPCLLNIKERVVIVDLVIRNDSFFDITIKPDAVAGHLSTNKKGLLHDPAKALIDLNHPPVENLKPTKEATFAVIQPVLRTEAEEIEDAIAEGNDGYFWLGSLTIPISVQNAEPLDIDSKPLRINSTVEHVYFREFGALKFDGKVITPRELLRDVEALPFPERLRIYSELSKAYEESLWQLQNRKDELEPPD